MKQLLVALIITLHFLNTQAQEPQNKSSIEPKPIFKLTINGKNYDVSEDEELKIDSLLSRAVISIKLSNYKRFDNSSISFEYPRYMSFEFEQEPGFTNWTFNGKNLVIIIFELDGKTPLSALADEFVKKFGKQNCVVEDFQKELGRKKWNGKKLNVSLIGEKLSIECYEILLNDNKSRFVYVQDLLTGKLNSKEYEEVLTIINSTIKFN